MKKAVVFIFLLLFGFLGGYAFVHPSAVETHRNTAYHTAVKHGCIPQDDLRRSYGNPTKGVGTDNEVIVVAEDEEEDDDCLIKKHIVPAQFLFDSASNFLAAFFQQQTSSITIHEEVKIDIPSDIYLTLRVLRI